MGPILRGMRGYVIAVVAVSAGLAVGTVAVGCLKKPTFECANTAQCDGVGPGATCEPDGFCSFTDGSCESGRRYGDNSGPNAGNCVGPPPPPDAPIDQPPPIDARVCYGAGAYAVCVETEPMGTILLSGTLDTDNDTRCLAAQPAAWTAAGQPASCFIVAAQIDTSSTVTVVGSRPLVLFAETIVINNEIDAASHRGALDGAAANSLLCAAFPTAPQDAALAGGGAGGSFTSQGGDGAVGANGGGAGGTAPAGDTIAPTILRGGCAGQPGATGTGAPGAAGAGGGAVFVSASTLTIGNNGGINASGAGGSAGGIASGGGGGGSGGMIVINVISISNAGALIANGGGGGGGGNNNVGAPGSDPNFGTPTSQANGGNNAGKGFAGSNVATDGTLSGNRAGGGGGGAGGYIQSNIAINGSVSPSETVVPN